MNLTRTSRLIQLIGLLQIGKGLNATELGDACQVSRRTIFRDLDILRQAGVPLIFDHRVGLYRIPGTYYLPPTNFTADEALTVIVLCRDLGRDGRVPFYGSAQAAASKLESSLPGPLREQLRETTGAVQIRMPPSSLLDGQQPYYVQLLHCTARRQAVRIHYESLSEDTEIVTKLSPYQLLFSRHSWYAIGRSSLHRETRTFNVSRIRGLETLEDIFVIPRAFSIERYLGNAWHLIPEPGPDQEVKVRFERLVARNVAEVAWHKTQRCEFLADGRMDFSVTVSGLNEISWWILGYGDQAEVLAPEPLRTLIAERVAGLARRYRNDHAML
jgi:proteasome accessory factor B